mmetsp:Transcript_14571/g.62442  ORF Transcript_14571/g.62442 Transcript_14571/m.62442 type:complete len:346 (+) Transcript_14571:1556-2593(+)
MAPAGMWNSTRGPIPRRSAAAPSSATTARIAAGSDEDPYGLRDRTAASMFFAPAAESSVVVALHATGSPVTAHTPFPVPGCISGFTERPTSHSATSQCVCMRVLTTSRGLVNAAARPPAKPPAANCAKNVSSSISPSDSFFLNHACLPSAIFALSYAVKCIAVNGTFIASVVGYERYSAPMPCDRTVPRTQSHTPEYGELTICSRCFTVSTGVCTASPITVAHAPASACAKGACSPFVSPPSKLFMCSYVAKYIACAGPAPIPTAATPRYKPATPSVLMTLSAAARVDETACRKKELEIEEEVGCVAALLSYDDTAVCMRVLMVSSGNIAVCSVVPATAPAAMCL